MIKRQDVGAPKEGEEISDLVVVGAGEQVPQQELMLSVKVDEVVHFDGPLGEAEDGHDFVELVKLEAEEVAGGCRTGTHRPLAQLRFGTKAQLLLDLPDKI